MNGITRSKHQASTGTFWNNAADSSLPQRLCCSRQNTTTASNVNTRENNVMLCNKFGHTSDAMAARTIVLHCMHSWRCCIHELACLCAVSQCVSVCFSVSADMEIMKRT